jgi:hypothetical protein
MNCDLAGRLIDDYLEIGLGERDRHLLEKHLASCRRCAAEFRSRPSFDRDMHSALTASVRPLKLPSEASTRIVAAAEQSLHRAIWSHRAILTLRVMTGTVAVALLIVGLFALTGHIPVPSHLRPIALLPTSMLRFADSQPVTLFAGDQPTPRHTVASTSSLLRASLLVEPWDLRPHQPYTVTVLLQSDLPHPIETVRLALDISGPTGFHSFALAVRGPLPTHGVSIFRVTPELLAESCREQYLISPTDLFSLPGVYTLRMTLFDAVAAMP